MKILLYNWAQFDDALNRGGGVTVYLQGLLNNLRRDSLFQCFFLSSGTTYTFDRKLRVVETPNCFAPEVRSFTIFNSPVRAPAYMQFSDLRTYLDDTTLLDLLDAFWVEHGGFDVVHFHNLEGLSLSVLHLKDRHPNTKFFFSVHNYFLFCPQVNLWASRNENCYLTPSYPNCAECATSTDAKVEGLISITKALLSGCCLERGPLYNVLKKGALLLRQARRKSLTSRCAQRQLLEGNCAIYTEFRQKNIAYANRYFDCLLAVSQRTAEIATAYGICADKLIVDYIGTTAASSLAAPQSAPDGCLCIGYLGYARADKGFDLLLKALHQVDPTVAQCTDVILAAKCDSQLQYDEYIIQISELLHHFHSFQFLNGYTKSEQALLLKRIHLGVIPSLWEDNLPQVAIEYIAAGVPILASDAGGAHELCANDGFIYHSTSADALSRKLEMFSAHPEKLSEFWKSPPYLMSMDKHIQNLTKYYTHLH